MRGMRSTLTVVLSSESQPLMGFSLVPNPSLWTPPRCDGPRISATCPSLVFSVRSGGCGAGSTVPKMVNVRTVMLSEIILTPRFKRCCSGSISCCTSSTSDYKGGKHHDRTTVW
ncbi:hypothetical protein K503DRAFT_867246 [Rhizopogon vinicolor AM-OR11-026]|uniref:Uncharacterized protein n=1 Tax=Rhizopogon vinicolor AM-OR11-026 TaxID=1314800 RepID=A0A1B7MW89_9AGAM|nr:hypothetical protein K503DRAFT_867246 [Rhizopogon vinicolor AM-OR11-026]